MTSIVNKVKQLLFKKPLFEKVDTGKIPKHVAIIMDGNGRWAKIRGLPRIAGHRAGAQAVREVVQTADDLGVNFITLYTFSMENWRRPRDEVSGLMGLFQEMLKAELTRLNQNNVRFKVIGDMTGVDARTREQFQNAVKKTENNSGLTLVIALNYSGRADIIKAIKNAAYDNQIEEMDETLFSKYLSTADTPDPELIIRTSGELRLSNFLIWESAYSEFWVTNILWPDFRKEHFIKAIFDYQRRERRFGGL